MDASLVEAFVVIQYECGCCPSLELTSVSVEILVCFCLKLPLVDTLGSIFLI